jgi:hypothetical protein
MAILKFIGGGLAALSLRSRLGYWLAVMDRVFHLLRLIAKMWLGCRTSLPGLIELIFST